MRSEEAASFISYKLYQFLAPMARIKRTTTGSSSCDSTTMSKEVRVIVLLVFWTIFSGRSLYCREYAVVTLIYRHLTFSWLYQTAHKRAGAWSVSTTDGLRIWLTISASKKSISSSAICPAVDLALTPQIISSTFSIMYRHFPFAYGCAPAMSMKKVSKIQLTV